jgi:hypothetical protein
MPPRVRTRANRNRSPTPNRPEDDPFAWSPDTKRQKELQEQYTRKQKNANERAKKYAKAFEKFLKNNTNDVNNKLIKKFKNIQNNTNKNHLQTTSANFKSNVRLMNRPTYLLSDVLNSNNGKIRHVYSRNYLDKVFKNKTIHRGPHTGVPTSPNMMRDYDGVNINARRHAIFKTQKALLISVYGRHTYYDTKLQTKHVTGQLQDHHIKLTYFMSVATRGGTFGDFVKKYLVLTDERAIYFKNLHNITEKQVNQVIKILNILRVEVRKDDRYLYLPFIHQLRVIFFAQRFNSVPPAIQRILNNNRGFYNDFNNVLNFFP